MANLKSAHSELLKIKLQNDFINHLPPLLDNKKSVEQQHIKNLSRAFSAFVISQLCNIKPELSSQSIIDDFDDKGVDAIYYDPQDETLYLVQSKIKASEMFGQDEALSFCQGVMQILRQDLGNFNKHVQKRRNEIEIAIENCNCIKLVIAYTGLGISRHAEDALNNLFDRECSNDERLTRPIIKFTPENVVNSLMDAQAPKNIDTNLKLIKWASINQPRLTYIGLIPLIDLVLLHKKYEKSLYEKNIRTFLGNKTDVNTAIQNTLSEKPQDFFYLHNGVAALCQAIKPKNSTGTEKNLQILGISIINGAQTIASAAKYIDENPTADINSAQVLITLIVSSSNDEFGKNVTKARNHQNSVDSSNFAALDNKQEILRKELAYLNFNYVYKAGVSILSNGLNHLRIEEAASALSLFTNDPRLSIILKREPGILLITSSEQYKNIFSNCTAQRLANSVFFLRYLYKRIGELVLSTSNKKEKLIYKHGIFALGWILAHQIDQQLKEDILIDTSKIEDAFSLPFDNLRNTFLEESSRRIGENGPLAFFKSQTEVIPLIESVSINYYGLSNDEATKRKPQKSGQPYPVDLFDYIIKKAPQISELK